MGSQWLLDAWGSGPNTDSEAAAEDGLGLDPGQGASSPVFLGSPAAAPGQPQLYLEASKGSTEAAAQLPGSGGATAVEAQLPTPTPAGPRAASSPPGPAPGAAAAASTGGGKAAPPAAAAPAAAATSWAWPGCWRKLLTLTNNQLQPISIRGEWGYTGWCGALAYTLSVLYRPQA